MKTETLSCTVSVGLLVMVTSLPAYAQVQTQSTDNWEIRLRPYVWILSIDAEATVGGTLSSLSANVDLGFDDIIDNLDFGAMGRVEIWKGRWGLTFDGLYLALSADKSFSGSRGLVDFDLDVDLGLGSVDFGLAYRLFEQQFGKEDKQSLAFEPYVGLRYAYLKEEIDLTVAIPGVGAKGRTLGKSEDWVEPFVGGRVIFGLNDKLAISIYGDAGGFGIGSASDLYWQIAGGVDYKLSENMTLNAGYRYLELDYSRGSGADKFGIDLRAKGPYVGLQISF